MFITRHFDEDERHELYIPRMEYFTLSMDMEFSAITIVFSEARYLQAALSTGFVVMQFIAWQQRKDAWKRAVLRCLSIWANIFGGIATVA